MPLTLGSLLQRLERSKADERFVYLMTSTSGPCRFGVYNFLNHIVLERLWWRDRVRLWSPKDKGYFDNMPAGTEMLVLTGLVAPAISCSRRSSTCARWSAAGQDVHAKKRYHRERGVGSKRRRAADLSAGAGPVAGARADDSSASPIAAARR